MTNAVAPALLDVVERHAPEVASALSGLHTAMWREMDPALLELCQWRMAMLHGDDAALPRGPARTSPEKLAALGSWPDSLLFSKKERACLAFTELFVADVSAITQDDVDAVLAELGPSETYGFTQSLLFLDQHQRLVLATARIFPSEGSA